MEDLQTLYKVLEIPESASPEEIHSAYRYLIREYHPDRLPASITGKVRKDIEEKFREILEAWKILSDPVGRKHYDEALKELRERPG